MGERTYDVSALMPDLNAVKRGVKAFDRKEAEEKAWRIFPKAVAIIVEERMNAWA